MKNNIEIPTKIFKALADESRLGILQEICCSESNCDVEENGCNPDSCVKNISEDLKLSKSTVSHHIKVLIDSGLIKTKKNGRHIYCEIDQETLNSVSKFINNLKRNK